MPTLNFEEIVTKISTEKGLTREEIEKKVKEKLNQLPSLEASIMSSSLSDETVAT